MSLDRWIDGHRLAVDRAWFWWASVCCGFNVIYTAISAVRADWGYVTLGLTCAAVLLAIAASAADDVAWDRGYSERPIKPWERRIRRWTRIALMGWSA